MTTLIDLLRKLRSPQNVRAVQAVEELRTHGWLCDGSLKNMILCHVHLQGADLADANLVGVDFHQAHLQHSKLNGADLSGARLTRANLQGADLAGVRLEGADLFKADLRESRNVTDRQLSRVKRLWGAVMPDGASYDGRYNLPGDLDFARWGGVDVGDPQAMADFLRVPLNSYLAAQGRSAELLVSQERI
jgi:uncharacterized protein YjbI with pentapeptide repeats